MSSDHQLKVRAATFLAEDAKISLASPTTAAVTDGFERAFNAANPNNAHKIAALGAVLSEMSASMATHSADGRPTIAEAGLGANDCADVIGAAIAAIARHMNDTIAAANRDETNDRDAS